jgi:hypothetical protein
MANPEKAAHNTAEQLANNGQERKRKGITGWLLSRGFFVGAGSTLGLAGYLAITGAAAAAVVTAPLAVWALGSAAVLGASLFTAGAVRGIFRGFKTA